MISYREDFPQLSLARVHDKPLVYLDSAASTLKIKDVIDDVKKHYEQEVSNIHRGVHYFSEKGTSAYEATREALQKLINAKRLEEIIFTSGTTASLNLVAQSYGRTFLKAGDEILITEMEHHSNIVPWQMLCEQNDCVLKVIPVNDLGELDLENLSTLLTSKTKLVSLVYVSNSLGTINPVKEIIQKAKSVGAVTVVDAAQAIAHMAVDVQDLDCDFLAFSGHKMFGPTGTGVLYGRFDLLQKMPPVNGGGDMIDQVTFKKTTYNDLPHKFEAGTPNISGFIGLKPAVDYLLSLSWSSIQEHEDHLVKTTTEELKKIKGLRLIGEAKQKASVVSFYIPDAHPHDLGTLLDQSGVAVRTGHHCTQPLMERFDVPATVRASFSIYNNESDVTVFLESLHKSLKMLGVF